VNTTSALPLAPVVVCVRVRAPPVAVQVIVTPGTGLPPRSVARAVSSVLEPLTVAEESFDTRTMLATGPARPVAWNVADVTPGIATLRTFTRAVSLIRQVFRAIPRRR